MKHFLYLSMALLVAAAQSAYAQDERFLSDEDVISVKDRYNSSLAPLGIPTGGFLFRPGIAVEEHYDDNVFRTPTNEQDDFITIVKPSAALESNWNRHALRVSADGFLAGYADNSDENYSDYVLSTSGRVDIAHDTYFSGALSHEKLHEDRSDPDDVNGDEPTELRNTYVGAGFDRKVSRVKMHIDARYRNVDYDNARAGGVTIVNTDRNRDEMTYTARMGYEFSPNYEAYTQYRYTDVNYDTATRGIDRSSDGHEIILGTALNISGKVKGDIYGGYTNRDFAATLEDVDTARYGGSLLWNVTGLTSLKAEVDRSVFETITLNASSYIRTKSEIAAEHALRDNLILEASGGLINDEFQGTAREDDTHILSAGAEYKPFRGASVKGGYIYTERDSDIASANYDSNKLYLSLGYSY